MELLKIWKEFSPVGTNGKNLDTWITYEDIIKSQLKAYKENHLNVDEFLLKLGGFFMKKEGII